MIAGAQKEAVEREVALLGKALATIDVDLVLLKGAAYLIAGLPAQRFGRKRVLIVIAVMYLLSAIGCASSSIWILFVSFRFIGGVAVGASSVVGPMYISEIAPARLRGPSLHLRGSCAPRSARTPVSQSAGR